MNVLSNGFGSVALSGGTLTSGRLDMGDDLAAGQPSFGVFTQSGGTHTNTGSMFLHSRSTNGPQSIKYLLTGGRLVATNGLYVEGGSFEQSGGSAAVHYFDSSGWGRTLLSEGDVDSYYVFVGYGGRFVQSGGTVHVQETLEISYNARYELNGGTLSTKFLTLIGNAAEFHHGNGTLTQIAAIEFATGTYFAGSGTRQLGTLLLGGASGTHGTIDLESGDPSILHFSKSAGMDWQAYGQRPQLWITNWAGSTNGGGSDQIYVGDSAGGLRPTQLAQIFFVNPAGLPAGFYRARMLATGEVVPIPRMELTFTRIPGGWVISWPGIVDTLSAAPEVTGPYYPIYSATSPYTNYFTEPQQFFLISSPYSVPAVDR